MAFTTTNRTGFTPEQIALLADRERTLTAGGTGTVEGTQVGVTTTSSPTTPSEGGTQTTTEESSSAAAPPPTIPEEVAQRADSPTLPEGAVFQPVEQTLQPFEAEVPILVAPGAVTTEAQVITPPEEVEAAQVQAAQIAPEQVPQVEAVQGEVSAQAQVTAATAEESEAFRQAIEEEQQRIINFPVDPNALVSEQYAQLTAGLEEGQTPPWAAAAVRAAESRLAARGLGASSVAGEAITAAVLQEALPLASQNAQVFQTMNLERFEAQASLGVLRATHIANLDITNLNNRQQAAVENARAFLSMDLSNADRAQQAAIVNSQNRMQTLLSNQAAENSARQFNATSENEVNTFMANLAQSAKMFNASQAQSAEQFNATIKNQRSLFNAEQRAIVQRSNKEYLRRINTANTVNQNQANLINSQNLLNISNTAIANEITLFRDRESYIFQASENLDERNLRRAIAELQANTNLQLQRNDQQSRNSAWLGRLASDVVGGIVDNVFDSGGGGTGG